MALRLVNDETGREHVRNALQLLGNAVDGLVAREDIPGTLTAAIERILRAAREWDRGNW